MNLQARIETGSVRGLIRLACLLALVGLVVLCVSVIVPRPIPVIFAMSVGHSIGIAAFLCYLLAVVLDAARREGTAPRGSSSVPPSTGDESSLDTKTKETGR